MKGVRLTASLFFSCAPGTFEVLVVWTAGSIRREDTANMLNDASKINGSDRCSESLHCVSQPISDISGLKGNCDLLGDLKCGDEEGMTKTLA